MLATRLAWRTPCSVYPMARVYSSAFTMYASTSRSRLTSSRVTWRPGARGVIGPAARLSLTSRSPTTLHHGLHGAPLRPNPDVLRELQRHIVVLHFKDDGVQ